MHRGLVGFAPKLVPAPHGFAMRWFRLAQWFVEICHGWVSKGFPVVDELQSEGRRLN